MSAVNLLLVIEQGATFNKRLTWKDSDGVPIDLTGYDARMKIREFTDSPSTLVSLTVANGRIFLGGALGTIDLFIRATTTELFSWEGNAVYDLELIIGSEVVRLVEGNVTLSPEVTR